MVMNLRYLLHTIVIVILSTGFTQAQTTISDTLSTNQNWTVGNSPYQLTDTVVIAQGVTLTIDPSVEVQFDAGLSSGIYLYQITTPSFFQTKKMLLIK